MKRDNDLVRGLLLAIEKRPPTDRIAGDSLGFDDRDEPEVVEHIRLLTEAGFIETRVREFLEDRHQRLARVEILRITWAGHEFLASIRSDTVWKKTQERVAKVGGSVSLSTLSEVAGAVAKGLLGL